MSAVDTLSAIELADVVQTRSQDKLGPADNVPALSTPTDTLSRVSSVAQSSGREIELPPVDRGRKAWLFVAAATVQEILVWGFSFSFSVFQAFLSSRFPDASNVAISTIGTTAIALEYCCLFFLMNFYRRYPELVIPFTRAAVVLCTIALFASSFATSVGQLILLQGVMFGLGGGVMYTPAPMWLYEWFSERRGLAGGIVFSGSGFGGFLIPLILGGLLDRVGYGWTLRIWSGIVALGSGLAMLALKPRLPLPPKGSPRASVIPRNVGWMVTPMFWAVTLTIFLQALGFLAVSLYISPFVTSLGLRPIQGQTTLAAFNAAAVAGQIGIGYLSDKRPFPIIMFISSLASALVALSLWGLADSLALVMLFAILFGAIAGGFSSVWAVAASEIAGRQSQHAGLVFSCFAVSKAVGAIAGPSISGALYDPTSVRLSYGQYGYANMVIFVGSSMAATAICSLVTQFVRSHHKVE